MAGRERPEAAYGQSNGRSWAMLGLLPELIEKLGLATRVVFLLE
jgi:hypothetical protein